MRHMELPNLPSSVPLPVQEFLPAMRGTTYDRANVQSLRRNNSTLRLPPAPNLISAQSHEATQHIHAMSLRTSSRGISLFSCWMLPILVYPGKNSIDQFSMERWNKRQLSLLEHRRSNNN